MNHPPKKKDFQELFVGLDVQVPTLNGGQKRYINLDNAASTPALKPVLEAVTDFLAYYSSVHRGTGFKSQLSTHAYETARAALLDFVGASPETHVCIFGKNTTEALNKLAHRFPFMSGRNVVITTGMEHHSNDLPWRAEAKPVHVALTPDGTIDQEDFDAKLAHHADRIALVAITGASNVTGVINPIHRLAEKAHAVGAQIAVDCAQLAPHRKVDMYSLDNPAHLDYVAISAHKMYAPFGSGALIGRRDLFMQGVPEYSGGGTIEIVTLDDVVWALPPDRDEAGSPNTVGAVAMAAATHLLQQIGMETVAMHETELTAYAIRKLADIPGLRIFGDRDPNGAASRLGVIPFLIEGLSHFLVAAILGYEFAIGVRNGCFCAHPYILHLLELSPEESGRVRSSILREDRREMPGLIRVSFGLYNTLEEVDMLVDALWRIVRGQYQGTYIQDKVTGEYHPQGWDPDFDRYLKINSDRPVL